MASDPKEVAARLRRHEVTKRHPKGGVCVAVHPDCAEAADMLEALAAERDAAWKAGAEAMRELAAQRCRYVLKYNEHRFSSDEEMYARGFETACKLCEEVIGARPIPIREGGDV